MSEARDVGPAPFINEDTELPRSMLPPEIWLKHIEFPDGDERWFPSELPDWSGYALIGVLGFIASELCFYFPEPTGVTTAYYAIWLFGTFMAFRRWNNAKPLPRTPFCIHCGYSLEKLPDDHRCPECGMPYNLAVINFYRRNPSRFRRMWKLRHAPVNPARRTLRDVTW